MTSELELAIDAGIPLEGVCLYPIIDRFEWENPSHWHNSGLWDFEQDADGNYVRVINEPYAEQLRQSQSDLAKRGYGVEAVPGSDLVSCTSVTSR